MLCIVGKLMHESHTRTQISLIYVCDSVLVGYIIAHSND